MRYFRLVSDGRTEIIRYRTCFCTDSNIPTADGFTHTAQCQRERAVAFCFRAESHAAPILAGRLTLRADGNGASAFALGFPADSYAAVVGGFTLRAQRNGAVTAALCLRTDGNRLRSCRTVIFVVRTRIFIRAVDGEIVDRIEVINSFAQVGNRLVLCDVKLASVDAVFNGRVFSCYGESVAGGLKGNRVAVFDVLRCRIAFCLQFPRTHDAVGAVGNAEVFFQLVHVQLVSDVSVRTDS